MAVLIERRVGLSTAMLVRHMTSMVLLVGNFTVRQRSVLMMLGLPKMVSTDWLASRFLNTDYSQLYSWSGTDGMFIFHGSCHGNLGSCESQQNC